MGTSGWKTEVANLVSRKGVLDEQGQGRAGVYPRQGDQLPRSGDPHSRLHSQQLQQVRQVHSRKLFFELSSRR